VKCINIVISSESNEDDYIFMTDEFKEKYGIVEEIKN
jgi:hypothetical protein